MMSGNAPHPFAPRFEFAFTIALSLTPAVYIRECTQGAARAAVWVESGKIHGPRIQGIVKPMSGGDYPLMRPDGVIDFDARYILQADDGAVIYMQNRGYRWGAPEVMARMARNEPVGHEEYYMRVAPKFEVPRGPHEWLAKHVFVGVAEKVPHGNQIHYFAVL